MFQSLQPKEVREPKFFPFRMAAYGWCYFLHVTGEPCSVRHLPSNKGLWHLVSKCTQISNELLTSNTYALQAVMFQPFLMASPSCIPAQQEQPSVDNPVRHYAPSLTEVRNQGVPLYYP